MKFKFYGQSFLLSLRKKCDGNTLIKFDAGIAIPDLYAQSKMLILPIIFFSVYLSFLYFPNSMKVEIKSVFLFVHVMCYFFNSQIFERLSIHLLLLVNFVNHVLLVSREMLSFFYSIVDMSFCFNLHELI